MSEENSQVQEVPVRTFLHYLRNLQSLVEQAKGFDMESEVLLQRRLALDMFPLVQQLTTAVNFSLRALCPLAEIEIPEQGDAENYTQLMSLI